jgi:hypothetical protein
MRRPGLGILTLLAALVSLSGSRAAEVVVANDSTVNGIPSTPGNFFLAGEETAAWLTSPCNGDVVAAQVYWTSAFGGNPPSQEADIALYAGGSFPTPGPILISQGGGNAVVLGPALSDMAMNEFRFLDPPADTQPL